MRIQRGRPRGRQGLRKKAISIAPDEQNNYIQLDPDCVKLFKLFATQGCYKIRILTNNSQKEPYYKQQGENIQESYFQQNNNCPEFFFLSQRRKNYSFANSILVDKTQYKQINQSEFDPKYKILITKLNIVLKELDEQFISILIDILQQYINLFDWYLDQNSFAQYIVEELQDPQNHLKYQYLINWQNQKQITKDVRMKMHFENLQNNKTSISQRISQKVQKKHQEFIEKQERHLNKEYIMEPIEYLISKLIRIFNKIMTKN
ncbi:unnamed protein product [Paramecium primaurelia]|uniref:Uncharacterized protein n=1 Tax=Paramecium primaurelia TaxID=5886 RepID=A0A8S1KT97_PARPR|nr:unnamed protein product [Paramecium primaurelia]